MSHEITREDALVLGNGEPAWHGLGLVVPGTLTTREALDLARLQWTVDKAPLQVVGGPYDGLKSRHVGLIRSDTRRELAVVTPAYEPLQNLEVADLIDTLAVEGASPRVETAGSLRQGRDVWFLVPLDTFAAAHGVDGAPDEVQEYILFLNSHDGTGAFNICATTIRVVCKNTQRAAMQGITIRHSQSVRERVLQAKLQLQNLATARAENRENILRMAAVPMDEDDVRGFFLRVYAAQYGAIPAKPATPDEERRYNKAVSVVSQWVANIGGPTNPLPASGVPSVWTAYNAVSEWADHKRTVRASVYSDNEADARAYSRLLGSGADFKVDAFERALVLAQ